MYDSTAARLASAEARLRSLQRQVDGLSFVCAVMVLGQFLVAVVGIFDRLWRFF